jgi:hypothetical protein
MNWLFRFVVLASTVSVPMQALTAHAADSLQAPVPPAPAASNTEGHGHQLIGVVGCNAVSCHGGRTLVGGEAGAWQLRDTMHRRAYEILFNEVSVAMAKKLDLRNDAGEKVGAHQHARCLACHSSSRDPKPNHGDRFAIEYGVGCESCHGAAGDWIAKHTTRTWKSLSTAQKSELGFRNLRSLTTRTETCVACHIGSPAATVDHDLIAAGHPRLAFEMSAFVSILPRHWDATVETQQDPGQEIRLWAIGQAASAKAMADIVAARAKKAVHEKQSHLLPDFAEFDCNACHHDLTEPTLGRPTLRQPLGTPRWGSWAIPSAKFLAQGTASEKSLEALLATMGQSRLRSAPANEVATAAQRASDDLASWLRSQESTRYDAAQASKLLHRVIDETSDAQWQPNWDGQMQRFLAIAAASQSLQRLTGKTPFTPSSDSRALIPLRTRLKYRPDHATPYGYDPKEVDALLAELRKSMAH